MAITQSLFHFFGTARSLSTVPILATVAVGAKMFYLAPLLIRWNFPLSEIPGPSLVSLSFLPPWKPEHSKMTRGYLDAIRHEFGTIARIGLHHIVVSDDDIIRQLLAEDLGPCDRESGVATAITQSDTYVRGYRVPKGTIVTLDHQYVAEVVTLEH